MTQTTKRFLIAFDFDHTIVDENSDIVAKDLLPNHALTDKLESMRSANGWTSYMQEVFNLLNEFGVTDAALMDSIVKIRAAPGILELFDYLKSENCEVIVISDSNNLFIEEWLKKHGLKSVVNKIYSNPAEFKAGKLHIDKYHIQDWCGLSSVNLCKGHILEEHIKKRRDLNGVRFDFVAYVGDGQNDVCPSLRLTDKDLVFPRTGMRLEAILRASESVKAKIVSWEDATTIVESLDSTS